MAGKEVRTKLVLDDQTSNALKSIQQGFEKTSAAQTRTQGGIGDFAKQTASTILAVNFQPMIQGIKNVGLSFIEAASAGKEFEQQTAGFLAMSGKSWDVANAKAAEYAGLMEEMSLKIAVPVDSIERGFDRLNLGLGEMGGGMEKNVQRIEMLAQAADVLGGDADAMAQKYTQMAQGMLVAKDQLFKMLRQTGVMKGEVRDVAGEWAKLTEGERIKILDEGMRRVVERVKGATPTFHDMTVRMQNLLEATKEAIGEPLLEALMPEIEALSKDLLKNKGEIIAYARAMSVDVGRWVRQGGQMIQEGFEWIRTHKDEIVEAFEEGAGALKAAIEFVLAHKEELMLIFAARAGVGAVQAAAPMAQSGAAMVGGIAPALGGGAMGAAGALGVLALSIAAVAAAAVATSEMYHGLADLEDTRAKGLKELESLMHSSPEKFDKYAKSMIEANTRMVGASESADELARQTGEIRAVDDDLIRTLIDLRGAQEQYLTVLQVTNLQLKKEIGDMAVEAAGQQLRLELIQVGLHVSEATEIAAQKFNDGGVMMAKSEMIMAGQASRLAQAWNTAAATNDQGNMMYIATMLQGNEQLQAAFIEAGGKLEGGFAAMIEKLISSGGMFDKLVGALKGAEQKEQGLMNFSLTGSGSVNIKIQQDFRDQDPDRVALVFERRLQQAAVRRLSASTSTPFGT